MLFHHKRRLFSVDEYLRVEEDSAQKSEFIDGEIYAMSGGSLEHNRLVRNLLFELHSRLKGSRCEVLPSDMRLFVEEQRLLTYPDLMVLCGRPKFLENRKDTVTDATLIVEVLSSKTASYDRGEKFVRYRSLPSFSEYLLVDQKRQHVEQHRRPQPEEWLMTEQNAGLLQLTSIGVEIPLEAIYEGVF